MSKRELVGAYLSGRIDRRRFVRGLVGMGVTATAAVTYADVLAAGASGPVPRRVPLSVYPTPGNDQDGEYLLIGRVNANNDAGGPTVVKGSTADSSTHFPDPGPARTAMIVGEQHAAGQFGVQGVATASGSPTAAAGIGVVATSAAGASLVLSDTSVPIPPLGGGLTSFWDTGAFVVNGGQVWYCYASGVGNNSKWVKMSSTLVTLPAPFRVYDSRTGQANPSGSPQGPLAFGGGARTINCTPAIPASVPAATILFNMTIAGTAGPSAGALLVWAAGATEPVASSINWSSPGQVVANAVTSGCNASQDVQVKCVASAGSSTGFILDVVGYYL